MLSINGIGIPFLYGTAWKKERTQALVLQAIRAGFRAIDTAAQPKHYQEHLVGAAVRDAIKADLVSRRDLFLQTKYTPVIGQDPRNMPYDQSASVTEQVKTSVASSLHNLRPKDDAASVHESYIDCLVLHSPLQSIALTLEAWRAMSSFVPSKANTLGISNVSLPVLKAIWDHTENADHLPVVVQNRFFADTKYDGALRAFCIEKGITYEGFWALTGNPQLLKAGVTSEVAASLAIEPEQALYALVKGLGIVPLNGTTNEERMGADLEMVAKVAKWKQESGNETQWETWMESFKSLLQQ